MCDRCGMVYNHDSLAWQHDWRGPRMQNLRILVCPTCTDMPQQNGQRTIIIPPDPVPILNPRLDPNMIQGFGPQYGPELVTNGDFASDDGWTLNQATIGGGFLNMDGASIDIPTASRTAADTITSGTYHYSFELVLLQNGDTVTVNIGGTSSGTILLTYPGTYDGNIISVASNQTISLISLDDEFYGVFDNFLVNRVLS